ncbi:MAG: hypothetical protein PHP80_10810, partial [Synergistaceae bacterium]|nr:hypothetical protein [Synergistaceae bacterium]
TLASITTALRPCELCGAFFFPVSFESRTEICLLQSRADLFMACFFPMENPKYVTAPCRDFFYPPIPGKIILTGVVAFPLLV